MTETTAAVPADNTKLVFIDLETTGTNETTDSILEIGVVITDTDLSELRRWTSTAAPQWDSAALGTPPLSTQIELVRDKAAPVVQEMHDANGLWDAVSTTHARPLAEVEADLTGVLAKYGRKHDFIIAGSGVAHFDRRFIAAQMPKLDKWFRYYCIDVGILRRTLVLIGREDALMPKQQKNHRALDDARLHLEEMRYLKASLAKVGA